MTKYKDKNDPFEVGDRVTSQAKWNRSYQTAPSFVGVITKISPAGIVTVESPHGTEAKHHPNKYGSKYPRLAHVEEHEDRVAAWQAARPRLKHIEYSVWRSMPYNIVLKKPDDDSGTKLIEALRMGADEMRALADWLEEEP